MPHNFLFRFNKSLQAAGYFLSLAGEPLPYKKLLKLLYIVDRKCLEKKCTTLTGDRVVAMRNGPVLHTILNLILGKDSQSSLWHQYLKYGEKFVFIVSDPGTDDLCQYEKDIIKSVHAEYGTENEQKLIEITHEFDEWKKYTNTGIAGGKKKSHPISLEDILNGICKIELLDSVNKNIAAQRFYVETLGAVE